MYQRNPNRANVTATKTTQWGSLETMLLPKTVSLWNMPIQQKQLNKTGKKQLWN